MFEIVPKGQKEHFTSVTGAGFGKVRDRKAQCGRNIHEKELNTRNSEIYRRLFLSLVEVLHILLK